MIFFIKIEEYDVAWIDMEFYNIFIIYEMFRINKI